MSADFSTATKKFNQTSLLDDLRQGQGEKTPQSELRRAALSVRGRNPAPSAPYGTYSQGSENAASLCK